MGLIKREAKGRRPVPWDGPPPLPGEYIASKLAGYVMALDAVTHMRGENAWGDRLVIQYHTIAAALVPVGGVVHPWPRVTPSDPEGPPRARQIAGEGPTAVMRSAWRDPDDLNPNARNPREIKGWRRYCPLRRIAAGGGQVTWQHIAAADELRRIYDIAEIGWSGARDGTPVVALRYGPLLGPSAGAQDQERAGREMTRVRRRFAAKWDLIDTIILRNYPMQHWCRLRAGRRPQVEMGRLLEVLDELAEHFATEVERAKADATV